MNKGAAGVVEQAGRYARVLDGTGGADVFEGCSSDGPIRVASDQELVQGLAAVSRLVRLAESERIKIAGELARRSEGDKAVSLARRMGTTGVVDLVSQTAGVPRDEAGTIVRLGVAVRIDQSFAGEALEPKHPHIAAALAAGLLDQAVAAAMVRALGRTAPGLTPGELSRLEASLVERAQEGHTADMLLAFVKQVPEHAHPESAKPTEASVKAAAKVTKRALENGLTRWILDLDPLTAGLFGAAVEASTARSRFRIVGEDEPTPTEDETDKRPLAVRRVDAVALLARNALKVDDGQVAGTAVTMLVHIGLHEFLTGIGAAAISGVEGTISASTARKLACEAEIIPVVLGGDSQPLDLGSPRRFFSEAQRRAMAARDQGCAGPNCDAPLSWTQAAHIVPAGHGPTNIDNGLLLCPRCHHLLDDHGWQVTRENGRWWWTPPPHIDFLGIRRPGGPPDMPDRLAG